MSDGDWNKKLKYEKLEVRREEIQVQLKSLYVITLGSHILDHFKLIIFNNQWCSCNKIIGLVKPDYNKRLWNSIDREHIKHSQSNSLISTYSHLDSLYSNPLFRPSRLRQIIVYISRVKTCGTPPQTLVGVSPSLLRMNSCWHEGCIEHNWHVSLSHWKEKKS